MVLKFQNLITYLDDQIIIQVGYQSLNNTNTKKNRKKQKKKKNLKNP